MSQGTALGDGVQTVSPNLLLNSGFENGHGVQLRNWVFPSATEGVTAERVEQTSHTGSAALHLHVASGVVPGYYQVYQSGKPVQPGKIYTFSAWVRTSGIQDGVGAYISLNFYDGGMTRLGYRDSDAHIRGTSDWKRLSVTTKAPEGTRDVRAIVLLNGHGDAYFDDIQLEMGDSVSEYSISRADREEQAKLAIYEQEATVWLKQNNWQKHTGKNIAILRDSFPRNSANSSPETIYAALNASGYRSYYLTAQQLSNPSLLSPAHFDLVLLPYGDAFPAMARETFRDYLAQGGCFFSTGGYAFDKQLIHGPAGWTALDSLPKNPGEKQSVLLDLTAEQVKLWSHGGGPGGPSPQIEPDLSETGQNTLRFSAHKMTMWATAASPPIPAVRLFPNWGMLLFRARGDTRTPKMIIEMHEKDGTRWKAIVPLTTSWKQVALTPSDFSFWPDGAGKGRGGPGDHPDLASITALMIGESMECVPDGGNYTFWLQDIRIADDPLAASRIAPVRMNTRVCTINDAMYPDPDQIGVFDPSHPLTDAVSANWLPALGLKSTQTALVGPFEGMAAVGVLSTQGHGFGPDNSRLIPLVESQDAAGRSRGALGSAMFQFGGYYKGSAWGFFGVSNRDLFTKGSPGLGLVPSIVGRLIDRLYLYGTEAEYICYRPGEKACIRTNVENDGSGAHVVKVTLRVTGARAGTDSTLAQVVTLAPHSNKTVEFMWTAPTSGTDIYQIGAVMEEQIGGSVVPRDHEENAVVIWREATIAQGPKVSIRDSQFLIDGKPTYLMGCENWWGTTGSVSQRSVLELEKDFQKMQDLGLHFTRCFIPWTNEADRRCSDALVYLAQKHKTVIFHAPALRGTVDAIALADEMKQAREIAARYKSVTGFIVDTCNETGLTVDDSAGQRAAFNAYLRSLYGTDDKLKAAWASDPPEKPLGEVPFRYPVQDWASIRARDVARFSISALTQWADQNRNAFEDNRPGTPMTPGWGQGFGWGNMLFDPPLASRNQDFTDLHYYGPLAEFPMYMKTIDRRWSGQPWSVGECGARQHPSFPDGESEADYVKRFLYLQHHAFAMGASFESTWHWRDPMAGIFPFGQVHADGTLRDSALVERNQSLIFGYLHRKYRSSKVFLLLPDSNRLGGKNLEVARGMHRAADTLLSLHVDFESLCEADLPHLPSTCRALVWPLPYCPSDAAYDTVVAYVRKGGTLLVTGDIGYDENRGYTREGRIRELTGATSIARLAKGFGLGTSAATAISPCGILAKEVPAFNGYPTLALSLPDGVSTATSAAGSVISVASLGTGKVMFVADAIELESPEPVRAIYGSFLKLSGIERFAITPDRADIHAFSVPTVEGGTVYIAYNSGPSARVDFAHSDFPATSIDCVHGVPGLIAFNHDGKAIEVEAKGEVHVSGGLVMRSSAHTACISLDGKPIAESDAIALLAFDPGSVRLARAMGKSQLDAEYGEVRDGKWVKLGMGRTDSGSGVIIAECSQEQRLAITLLAPAGKMEIARQLVTRRLTR